MYSKENDKLISEIKLILSKRNISNTITDFVLAYSDGHTNDILKLTAKELIRLKTTLNEFNPSKILKGIYSISLELGIIKNEILCPNNTSLIIDFMKLNLKLEIKNDLKPVDENYIELYIVVKRLGDFFMEKGRCSEMKMKAK